MSYTPPPGTVAFRAIAHLETLPRGAELMTSALAEAIGCDGKNIVPSLDAALGAGLVFRRQRDPHRTSPMWWSLTDPSKGATKKPAASAWEPRKADGLDDALAQPLRRRASPAAQRTAPTAKARAYPHGHFTELIRRHLWPPMFEPRLGAIVVRDRNGETAGEVMTRSIELARAAGKAYAAGTIPLAGTRKDSGPRGWM